MKSDDASWVEEVMSTQYVKIVTEVEEKLDKAQELLEELKNGYRATMLQEGEKISYDGIIYSTREGLPKNHFMGLLIFLLLVSLFQILQMVSLTMHC